MPPAAPSTATDTLPVLEVEKPLPSCWSLDSMAVLLSPQASSLLSPQGPSRQRYRGRPGVPQRPGLRGGGGGGREGLRGGGGA